MKRREATSTMVCCDLREDEDRVALRRRETSSTRRGNPQKSQVKRASNRLETTKINREVRQVELAAMVTRKAVWEADT